MTYSQFRWIYDVFPYWYDCELYNKYARVTRVECSGNGVKRFNRIELRFDSIFRGCRRVHSRQFNSICRLFWAELDLEPFENRLFCSYIGQNSLLFVQRRPSLLLVQRNRLFSSYMPKVTFLLVLTPFGRSIYSFSQMLADNFRHFPLNIPIKTLCFVFFFFYRHQLLVPSGHTRWDIRAKETATQPHHIHAAATGGAGNGIRSDALSGRVHARGPGDEDQFDRGSCSGAFNLAKVVVGPYLCGEQQHTKKSTGTNNRPSAGR